MEIQPPEDLQRELNINGLQYISFLQSIGKQFQPVAEHRVKGLTDLDVSQIDQDNIFIGKGFANDSCQIIAYPNEGKRINIFTQKMKDGSIDVLVSRDGSDYSSFELNLKEDNGNWNISLSRLTIDEASKDPKALDSIQAKPFGETMKHRFDLLNDGVKNLDEARTEIAKRIILQEARIANIMSPNEMGTTNITAEVVKQADKYLLKVHPGSDAEAKLYEIPKENYKDIEYFGIGSALTFYTERGRILFPLDRNDNMYYSFRKTEFDSGRPYIARLRTRRNMEPSHSLEFLDQKAESHAINISQLRDYEKIVALFGKVIETP